MEHIRTDVIVIGSGAAGLCAAIEASNRANVLMITKDVYTSKDYKWSSKGGCSWKTHAFNAAITSGDSIDEHIKDTLKGGNDINYEELVKVLCYGSIEAVHWLESLGINFAKDIQGNFITRPFGGCGKARAVSIQDMLGFHIQKVLMDNIRERISQDKIRLISGFRAIDLIKTAHNEVCGVQVFNPDTFQITSCYANSVILADGGGASMYSPTAASMDKTCDGIAIALRAGAKAVDLEFVQFHPTGLAKCPAICFEGSLVEEAIRFEDAELLNRYNKRFMFDYDQRGERATRDQVSIGIFKEIKKGNDISGAVKLDISRCKSTIPEKYPALNQRIFQAGIDLLAVNFLLVRPTAHFLMGGLQINQYAECSLPGLYSAGETAGGVHGSNRLGGNGLSEALVFGRIAGIHAAEYAVANGVHQKGFVKAGVPNILEVSKGKYYAEELLHELKDSMYWNAGPVRDRSSLRELRTKLKEIEEKSQDVFMATGSWASLSAKNKIDLENLVLVSQLIVHAALERQESRGSHHRSDYPEQSDNLYNQVVSLDHHLVPCFEKDQKRSLCTQD